MKVLSRNIGYVRPVEGEEFRFFVDSSTFGQPPHLVDLLSNRGYGKCDCADYVCKKNQNRLMGETRYDLITCRHIRMAQAQWCRRKLLQIAAEHIKKYGAQDE